MSDLVGETVARGEPCTGRGRPGGCCNGAYGDAPPCSTQALTDAVCVGPDWYPILRQYRTGWGQPSKGRGPGERRIGIPLVANLQTASLLAEGRCREVSGMRASVAVGAGHMPTSAGYEPG